MKELVSEQQFDIAGRGKVYVVDLPAHSELSSGEVVLINDHKMKIVSIDSANIRSSTGEQQVGVFAKEIDDEPEEVMTFRRVVKPEHLNAANTLFGGTLMAWMDEGCALYAMCQMKTKRIVTLKVSEVMFRKPVRQADLLEFKCSPVRYGNSSFTLKCIVERKEIGTEAARDIVAECEMVFVSVGEDGRPVPYVRN